MNQGLGGGAWHRTALPGEIGIRSEDGREGAEDEFLGEDRREEPVKTDRRAESFAYEMRCVVEEIVGRGEVEVGEGLPEPAREKVHDHPLAGGDDGRLRQILRRNRLLAGERIVGFEEKSPAMCVGEVLVVEFLVASRADEERQVDRPVGNPARQVLAVSRDDPEVQLRMRRAQRLHRPCQTPEGRHLSRADDNGAGKISVAIRLEALFGACRELDDVPRATQKHAPLVR